MLGKKLSHSILMPIRGKKSLVSLGLKWNLKGKKPSPTCALRAEEGASREEEKVEGSRWCHC